MPSIIQQHANGWQISNAILSFPKLFVPKPGTANAAPDARKSYGCDLILEPDTNIDAFWGDMQRAAFETHGENFNNMDLNWPIRQSGSKKWDDPQFQGRWVIHCSRPESQGKPNIVDGANNNIIDPGVMYPGVIVGVYVTVYGYSKGSLGVNCGLETVVYQGEGTRLDNRMSVADQTQGMAGAVPPMATGAPSASPPGQPVANTAPPGGMAPPGQQQPASQPPAAPTQTTPGTSYVTPPGVTPPQT